MSKLFWNTLKLSPILLGATLLLASRTQAAETTVVEVAPTGKSALIAELRQLDAKPVQVTQTPVESTTSQTSQNTQVPAALEQTPSVSQLSNPAPDAMAQVTSVTQLTDVQPTDWAFQALQSLVERYGVIAGYPDGTFRGNRAMTRYEFAAGLNAALDRVNELIAAGTADLIRREDLATLQRLQEEFAAELATLRGRVDTLEARTAELEANQFSTTTQLVGEAVFAVSGFFGEERAVPSGRTPGAQGEVDDNVTFSNRARLSFNTSFFGTDLLTTRLQGRNITPFGTGVTGTNMTRLGFDGDEDNDLTIDQLFYRFPVGEFATIQIDAFQSDNLDARGFPVYSPVASSGRGAISRYGRFSPIYRQGSGGAGGSINLNPQGPIGLTLSYLAPTANDPRPSFGLADGAYAAVAQLNFRPTEALNLGLTYAHTYDTPERRNINMFESTGSILANSPFGNVPTSGNHYGVEGSFRLTPRLTLFGWGGYTQAIAEASPRLSPVVNGTTIEGNRGSQADIWYYAGGLALQDFGREGGLLGIIFGQPPRLAGNDVQEVAFGNRRRVDNDVTYHLEGFYRFPLTDNIEVTPGVLVIFNPEHNDNNPTEYVGTLRTTFRF